MGDRPEDRAARVEKILETSGNLEEAMQQLNREMEGRTPQERGQILNALKQQNEKANDKDWSLPNVEISQASHDPFGLFKKEGEYNVKFSQNVFERIAKAVNDANPFNKIARTLEQASNPEKKR